MNNARILAGNMIRKNLVTVKVKTKARKKTLDELNLRFDKNGELQNKFTEEEIEMQ